jgi:hypothetical protein
MVMGIKPGRRLQETALQRQRAPDVLIKIEVEETRNKLVVNFVDDGRLVLAQGATKSLSGMCKYHVARYEPACCPECG